MLNSHNGRNHSKKMELNKFQDLWVNLLKSEYCRELRKESIRECVVSPCFREKTMHAVKGIVYF